MKENLEESMGGFSIYAGVSESGEISSYVIRAAGLVKHFLTRAQAEDWIRREFSEEERRLIEQVVREEDERGYALPFLGDESSR